VAFVEAPIVNNGCVGHAGGFEGTVCRDNGPGE
jgi:hypothetical protein